VALALLGGEIPMGISTMEDFAKHHQSGALRIIGITNAKRSSLAPELPTMMEQGIDFKSESWSAMWTNAGTPPQKIKEIADAVKKALEDPDVKAKLAVTGSEAAFASGDDLGKLQAAEWKAWTPVIEASGFKPGN
jgi:tripartite-type tricarboxylate transporter receptor subunit TctC